MVVERSDELAEEKLALEKTIKNLKDDNEILKLKLEQLEKDSTNQDFSGDLFNGEEIYDSEDREVVKTKIAKPKNWVNIFMMLYFFKCPGT